MDGLNYPADADPVGGAAGQGFWLAQKRLSRGRFSRWPESRGDPVEALAVHELQLLLWNGDPKRVRVALPCRKLATS